LLLSCRCHRQIHLLLLLYRATSLLMVPVAAGSCHRRRQQLQLNPCRLTYRWTLNRQCRYSRHLQRNLRKLHLQRWTQCRWLPRLPSDHPSALLLLLLQLLLPPTQISLLLLPLLLLPAPVQG
jgi:hypothetical protein